MKRFLASILGIVVFGLLILSSAIYIAREVVSEDTISKVLTIAPTLLMEDADDEEMKELIREFTQVLEEAYPGISEYFDEKEFMNEIIALVSGSIENIGNPDKELLVDTKDFKNYIGENIKKYEKATNTNVDDALEEELYKTIDEELHITKESLNLGETVKIFEFVFLNEIFISLLSGIVLCVILMFILLGKLQDTLLKVKTPFMVNGIIIGLIGFAISSFISEIKVGGVNSLVELSQIVSAPFFKVAIISIVISVVLIVVAKILKHNKSISNSNAAIENLGNTNYIPNNNISNTPYNGYQNH